MNQPFRRRVTAFARPGVLVASVLAIGLLVALLLGAAGVRAAGAPDANALAAGPPAYCYSWEFLNNTGQDADGLHIRLQGVQAVTAAYEGPGNPFGLPLGSSGYDTGLDAYRLEFGGGPALDGDMVHLGACTDRPVLRLGTAAAPTPPFHWSSDDRVLQPAPLFLGAGWLWAAPGQLRVRVTNDTAAALVLWSFDLLAADGPLNLGDLDGDALASLQVVAMLAPDPLVLPAGAAQSFDVSAEALGPLTPGRALLLQADFSAEEDLGNGGALYAQLLLPRHIYLPLILR